LKIDIVERETPELSDPIVICGLPGSALVGKLAVDHLIEELPAQQMAEIYLDGLAPQVFVESDGTVTGLNNDIFYWKSRVKGSRDLILYTADAQPTVQEAEYKLSEFVIDYFRSKFKAREMITLGAYVTGAFPKDPKVYVAATEDSLVKEAASKGCQVMTEGTITGMNGILLGIAKLKGMRGYSLLGETSGYALDPKASEALLRILEKLTGIKVDLKELEVRAKEAEGVLQNVEALRKQQEGQEAGEGPQDQAGQNEDKKKLGYIS
jgi:uncharacterized protein (TIGR00162 family)